MSVFDYVRINGTKYTWGSVSLRIDVLPLLGILSFDYEETRERAILYGGQKNGKPLGRGAGKVTYPPMTLSVMRETGLAIMEYLTVKGLGSYGDAEFTISLNVEEPLAAVPPIVATFSKCVIDGRKNSSAEGTEGLKTDFTISTLEIVENGMTIASQIRSVPAI